LKNFFSYILLIATLTTLSGCGTETPNVDSSILPDTFTTQEDTTILLDVLANDTNLSKITFVTNPDNGTVSIQGNKISYTPNLNFFGTENLIYKANYSGTNLMSSSIKIIVTPVNDKPSISTINDLTITEGDSINMNVTLGFSDVDPGTTLSYSSPTLPSELNINSISGLITGTPSSSTTLTIGVVAFDGHIYSDTNNFKVFVNPLSTNNPPASTTIPDISVAENQSNSIQLSNYFSDPEDNPLTFVTTNADDSPAPSWVSISQSGELILAPTSTGTIPLNITATDTGQNSVTSNNFSVIVTPDSGFVSPGLTSVFSEDNTVGQESITSNESTVEATYSQLWIDANKIVASKDGNLFDLTDENIGKINLLDLQGIAQMFSPKDLPSGEYTDIKIKLAQKLIWAVDKNDNNIEKVILVDEISISDSFIIEHNKTTNFVVDIDLSKWKNISNALEMDATLFSFKNRSKDKTQDLITKLTLVGKFTTKRDGLFVLVKERTIPVSNPESLEYELNTDYAIEATVNLSSNPFIITITDISEHIKKELFVKKMVKTYGRVVALVNDGDQKIVIIKPFKTNASNPVKLQTIEISNETRISPDFDSLLDGSKVIVYSQVDEDRNFIAKYISVRHSKKASKYKAFSKIIKVSLNNRALIFPDDGNIYSTKHLEKLNQFTKQCLLSGEPAPLMANGYFTTSQNDVKTITLKSLITQTICKPATKVVISKINSSTCSSTSLTALNNSFNILGTNSVFAISGISTTEPTTPTLLSSKSFLSLGDDKLNFSSSLKGFFNSELNKVYAKIINDKMVITSIVNGEYEVLNIIDLTPSSGFTKLTSSIGALKGHSIYTTRTNHTKRQANFCLIEPQNKTVLSSISTDPKTSWSGNTKRLSGDTVLTAYISPNSSRAYKVNLTTLEKPTDFDGYKSLLGGSAEIIANYNSDIERLKASFLSENLNLATIINKWMLDVIKKSSDIKDKFKDISTTQIDAYVLNNFNDFIGEVSRTATLNLISATIIKAELHNFLKNLNIIASDSSNLDIKLYTSLKDKSITTADLIAYLSKLAISKNLVSLSPNYQPEITITLDLGEISPNAEVSDYNDLVVNHKTTEVLLIAIDSTGKKLQKACIGSTKNKCIGSRHILSMTPNEFVLLKRGSRSYNSVQKTILVDVFARKINSNTDFKKQFSYKKVVDFKLNKNKSTTNDPVKDLIITVDNILKSSANGSVYSRSLTPLQSIMRTAAIYIDPLDIGISPKFPNYSSFIAIGMIQKQIGDFASLRKASPAQVLKLENDINSLIKTLYTETTPLPILNKSFLKTFKSQITLQQKSQNDYLNVSFKDAYSIPSTTTTRVRAKMRLIKSVCRATSNTLCGRIKDSVKASFDGDVLYISRLFNQTTETDRFSISYYITATNKDGKSAKSNLVLAVDFKPNIKVDNINPYTFNHSFISMQDAYQEAGITTTPLAPNKALIKLDIFVDTSLVKDSLGKTLPDIRAFNTILQAKRTDFSRFEDLNKGFIFSPANIIKPSYTVTHYKNSKYINNDELITTNIITGLQSFNNDPYVDVNAMGKVKVGTYYLNPLSNKDSSLRVYGAAINYVVDVKSGTQKKWSLLDQTILLKKLVSTLPEPSPIKDLLVTGKTNSIVDEKFFGDNYIFSFGSTFINSDHPDFNNFKYSVQIGDWSSVKNPGAKNNIDFFYPIIKDKDIIMIMSQIKGSYPFNLVVTGSNNTRSVIKFVIHNLTPKPQTGTDENASQHGYHLLPTSENSDINVESVHESGILGKGIVVTVVDNGASIRHPDIAPNFIKDGSYNFHKSATDYRNDTTHLSYNQHGTNTSSVIGALKNNVIGAYGVSPGVSLKSMNWLESGNQSTSNLSMALGHDKISSDTDIFNQSWGFSGTQGTIKPGKAWNTIYNTGVSLGRNGKGYVYIKSSGNNHAAKCDSSPFTGIDIACGTSMVDTLQSLPAQIVVGGIDKYNKHSSFASTGSNLWITAPATRIFMADFSKNYAKYGLYYYKSANGTSFSGPIVAGVAALMLETNPNLGWRDVKHIMASTADKVDPLHNSTVIKIDNVDHVLNQQWVTNAAGYNFNNWHGFGKINAEKVVAMAKEHVNLPKQIIKKFNFIRTDTTQPLPLVQIADNSASGHVAELTTIDNTDKNIVETVSLGIDLSAEDLSDVSIEIISPAGTKSILWSLKKANHNKSYNFYKQDLLTSNAFYGESSEGIWKMRIIDAVSGGSTFYKSGFNFELHTRPAL
jgi:subtilisin family serine protease